MSHAAVRLLTCDRDYVVDLTDNQLGLGPIYFSKGHRYDFHVIHSP